MYNATRLEILKRNIREASGHNINYCLLGVREKIVAIYGDHSRIKQCYTPFITINQALKVWLWLNTQDRTYYESR